MFKPSKRFASVLISYFFLSTLLACNGNEQEKQQQHTTSERVTQVSYQEVTWTFSEPVTTGEFVNGDKWVLGPVAVSAISPFGNASGRNGSVLNFKTNQTKNGFDARIKNTYDATLDVSASLPLL